MADLPDKTPQPNLSFFARRKENGWPIPGSTLDGGAPKNWVMYPYSPYFSPPAGAKAASPPVVPPAPSAAPPKKPDNDGIMLMTPTLFNAYEDFWNGHAFPDGGNPAFSPALTPPSFAFEIANSTFLINDIAKDGWCKGLAGSARPGRPLKGKQYLEITIIELPVNVPPDSVLERDGFSGFQRFGDGTSSPCFESNGLGPVTITLKWPLGLNTFLNPVIGLWPKDKTFGKYDVIGLDDPDAKYRSIGVTRTSVLHGVFSVPGRGTAHHLYGDLFRAPDINIGQWCGRNEWGDISQPSPTDRGDCAFTGDGGVMLPFPSVAPAEGAVAYGAPVFKGRADMLSQIKKIPPDVSTPFVRTLPCTPAPSRAAYYEVDAGTVSWSPSDITSLDNVICTFADGSAVSIPVNFYLDSAHRKDLGKSWVYYSLGSATGFGSEAISINESTEQVTIFVLGAVNNGVELDGITPSGVYNNDDSLQSSRFFYPDDHQAIYRFLHAKAKIPPAHFTPSPPTPTPAAPRVGEWTGVDLGKIVVGDTVMMATDVDSRKVWFGKNGLWFGPPPSFTASPAAGVGWATLMDGDPNYNMGATPPGAAHGKPGDHDYLPGQQNYYPGVSIRYGPTTLAMSYGSARLKYPVPTGFKAFFARYI